MKLDLFLVDFAVVAMVIAPYLVFIMLGGSEIRKLKNKFLLEADAHLGKTYETIRWNQSILGVDRNLQKMVLVQCQTEGFRVEALDLKLFKSGEIKADYTTIRVDKVSTEILKRIDLEFSCISGEKKYLNLYDQSLTYSQDFELKHAEKVKLLIQGCLSLRPVITSAA